MTLIKVLLVEDETVLAMVIRETLANRGFDVSVAKDGVEGWRQFHHNKPDICVFDIMIPRKDGISLAEDIRKIDTDCPIIFLTAKSQTDDILRGFHAGGDDYMKKPFSMEELIVRIKSLLKRVKISPEQVSTEKTSDHLEIGSYRFNHSRSELIHHGKTVSLSHREADLLQMLIIRKHQLLEKRTALLKIWGNDDIYSSRSMDVYVTKLRKYLSDDPTIEILNFRGRGYKIID